MSKEDKNYYLGMEHGVGIVKEIMALSISERKERFGKTDVASILDDFDFRQIKNLMDREIVLSKRYIIRAIGGNGNEKSLIGESVKYKEYPSDDMILDFWGLYPDAAFLVVEEVYVREVEP